MTDSNPKDKRSTLYDVARRADVSHQTVSRVINNHPNVSLKTRRKVLKAIEELGFAPNKAAQILNTKRSYVLEMITTNFYASSALVLAGMVTTAGQHGYHFTVRAASPDDVANLLQTTLTRMVDGTILGIPLRGLPLYPTPSLPLVQLAGEPRSLCSSVYVDQRAGAELAVRHLLDLGHRHIVHLRGPSDVYDAHMRFETWNALLQQEGLPRIASAERVMDAFNGYDAMNEILATDEPFTAVFAANDLMALGAIHALHDHGLRVPDDVSLVGFDDADHAAFSMPRLTTIRQHSYQLGALAVELLIEQIEKLDTPVHRRVLMPELVIRDSTRQVGG